MLSMLSMLSRYYPKIIQWKYHASHAFHAFIFVNSHASHAFHGFPWFFIPCFPCFHGELSYNFCCPMLAWKAWEFPHENHGILLWLHAPWFSRESMEFSPCFFHGFSMVFPCFQYQGMAHLKTRLCFVV